MTNIKNKLGTGRFTSWYAASTQGLHGVLIILLAMIPVLAMKINDFKTVYTIVVAAIVEVSMLVFAAVVTAVNRIKNDIKVSLRNLLFSKEGATTMFAGVLGGAIGTSLLTLGIVYAGESYGIVLSVFFPVISAIISHWLFKEKINKIGLLALLGVAGSAVLLTLLGGESKTYDHLFIGILFGLLAGGFWALEAIIISYVFRESKLEYRDEEALLFRQMGSAPFVLLVVLPIMSSAQGENFMTGYKMLGDIISDAPSLFAIIGCGLNLFLSWWAYFNAIRYLGATNATTINITYIVWAPIFGLIIYPMAHNSWDIPNWSYWVFSITLMVSVIMVIRNIKPPTKNEQHRV